MDEKAVFKRYDVRGRYPEELNEDFAKRIGKSVGTFATKYCEPKVVVTKDTKQTSDSLKEALIEGITSTGAKVLDAGTGPTDYTAFTGKENNCISVQVTSSHLPLDFNGFKFMYPDGNGFTNPDLDGLKQLFRDEDFEKGESETVKLESALEKYRNQMKKYLEDFNTDFDKKIIVDTLGGATHPLIIEMLDELGAKIVDLAEDKKEKPYRNPPDPKPEKLEELKHKVNEENADLGIASDMDGDRATVYRNGFISGNQLFGVFAQLVNSDIVASIDTSEAVEKVTELDGNKVTYSRVGDPFVLEKAIEEEVELAGEPNGHYAFLDFVPYPSGTLSAVLAVGIDLAHYLSKLPDYHVERRNVEVGDKKQKMKAVKDEIRDRFELISEMDGIKFRDGDATVLVRSSGSSSKLRIIVESENPTTAEEVSWKVEKLIQNA